MSDRPEPSRGRRFTVLLALVANAGVGVAKLAAGLLTGSAALLSEAAHSAGDTTTETMLLVALRRSKKPADRTHPFGYGKERFFWSLLAAVGIFVSGAVFSIFEGARTLLAGTEPSDRLWVNYIVLAIAAVLEGASLRQAARQVRRQTRHRRRSVASVVLEPEDPTVNSVFLEDFTAMVGIGVAAAGVALHQITGSSSWDAAASLIIGVLLLCVAIVLARTCEALLIGKQADAPLLADIEKFVEGQDEIVDVVDLLTMVTGVSRVLVCVRADFVDSLTGGDIEGACVRIDAELKTRHSEIDEVFVQPASREDRDVREHVRQRYGQAMADKT